MQADVRLCCAELVGLALAGAALHDEGTAPMGDHSTEQPEAGTTAAVVELLLVRLRRGLRADWTHAGGSKRHPPFEAFPILSVRARSLSCPAVLSSAACTQKRAEAGTHAQTCMGRAGAALVVQAIFWQLNISQGLGLR